MERHIIKVFFENGDSFITGINGTVKEIKSYYIGNIFNIGCVDDNLQKAIKVDFLK